MREYEGGEESPRGGTDMNKRRLNYTLSLVVVLSFLLVLGLSGCTTLTSGEKDFSGPTRGFGEGSPNTFPLYAGQTIPVGEVQVWNDDENVCVKYQLSDDAIAEGWLIYETHLAVGATLGDIPQTKKGNPIPGQFPYGDDDLDGVESYQECVPLPAGVSCDDDIIIAAHAVVEKTECEIITEAPYGGLKVVNYAQGLRYDYTSVRSERSNPNAVLAFEEGHNESYFFSLGFNEDRSGYSDVDAWIIVEFDKPIQNGTGNDLRVVEDTWGLPYPDETADVWVSKNGTDWKYLGEADNQHPMSSYHTITDFDLDDVGLDWAKFVKVQNTSVRDDFARLYPGQGSTLDGYDLNAILALQNYQECTTYSETAWGAGDRFVEQGNWATYITYTVECEEPTPACSYETAWGGDTEGGGGKGWWYYFDPSKGLTQTIWAGQIINVGNVTVSGCSDGKATITITLTDGWELQDVDKDGKPVTEPVKIQGYDEIPDERPPAGKFETYKSNSPTVEVPCFNYYAIHLDVQLCE